MNAACILQYKAYSATLKEIWLPGDGIKVYAIEVRAIMSIENLVPAEQFLRCLGFWYVFYCKLPTP